MCYFLITIYKPIENNYKQVRNLMFKHICDEPLSNFWIKNLQCH